MVCKAQDPLRTASATRILSTDWLLRSTRKLHKERAQESILQGFQGIRNHHAKRSFSGTPRAMLGLLGELWKNHCHSLPFFRYAPDKRKSFVGYSKSNMFVEESLS